MVGIRHVGAVVRLAASHSATEAFVAAILAGLDEERPLAVELVSANSQVVRAHGRERPRSPPGGDETRRCS